MKRSESITKLLTKMQIVKAAVGAVQFDSTNPFFNSKYFSLGALYAAINPICAEVGIINIQTATNNEDGWPGIDTLVYDIESGEWIEDAQFAPYPEAGTNKEGKVVPINPLHVTGQVDTYLRRYTLVTIYGLIGDDDVDGNIDGVGDHAQAPKAAPVRTPVRQPVQRPTSAPVRSNSSRTLPTRTTSAPSSAADFSEDEPYGLTVRSILEQMNYQKPSSEAQAKFVTNVFVDLIPDEQLRHLVKEDILGTADHTSLDPKVGAFLNWLKPELVDTGELNSKGNPKKVMKYPEDKKKMVQDAARWHELFTFGNVDGEF